MSKVVPTDNFEVYAYCNDGAIRFFDVKPLITKGGVFSKISNLEYFKETLTVLNGTIAWDIGKNRDEYKCIDIDPFVIFDNCPVVNDPLEQKSPTFLKQ